MVATTDVITADAIDSFNGHGFVVLEDFATQDEVRQLRDRAQAIMDARTNNAAAAAEEAAIFSTVNQQAQTNDKFLNSGATVDLFMEEKDQSVVNKIGHAMHDLDPVFRSWCRSEKVAALLRALGFRRPLPVQSMYILKHSLVGGEVVPHQDSTFLWTEPRPSVVGLWLALEDATTENGCLWTLPGSQRAGVHKRFVRSGGEVSFTGEAPEFDLATFQPVEVKSGTLVVLHGANVHMSYENRSPHSRHAFSLHVAEGAPGYTWASDNWLQRPLDMPFKPLYDEAAGQPL